MNNILVLYRYHSDIIDNNKISYLLHLHRLYEAFLLHNKYDGKFFLIIDNTQESIINDIKNRVPRDISIIVENSDSKILQLNYKVRHRGHYTLYFTCGNLIKQYANENTICIYSEDDYIYRPDSIEKSIKFLNTHKFDFVSLIDHPNRYLNDGDEEALQRKPYRLQLIYENNHHWRTTISSCHSFMCTYICLKQLDSYFECNQDKYEGRVSLLNPTQTHGDHSMWCAIWRSGQHKLWGPIPGLAIHKNGPHITNGLIWEKYLDA